MKGRKRGSHSDGGMIHHVLNRVNARARIFAKDADYSGFERVMCEIIGIAIWQERISRKLGLESTFRPCGRPKETI